jgi:hypothetical protein
VIIEYKRALNENVMNQGLFYLDWLLDHKDELVLLVQNRLNQEATQNVNWRGARYGRFNSLKNCGLKRAKLVTNDKHENLGTARRTVFVLEYS